MALHIRALTSPTCKGGPRLSFYGIDRRAEIYDIVIDGDSDAVSTWNITPDEYYYITNFSIDRTADKDAYVTLYTESLKKSHVSSVL